MPHQSELFNPMKAPDKAGIGMCFFFAFVFVFCICVGIWTSDISVRQCFGVPAIMEEEQQHDTEMRLPKPISSETSTLGSLADKPKKTFDFKPPRLLCFQTPGVGRQTGVRRQTKQLRFQTSFQCLEINAKGGIYEPRCVILRVLNLCRCVPARGFVSKKQQTRPRFMCAGGW
jgi:hypothetical protein